MQLVQRQLNSLLIKPAGPDCNIACDYCFYCGKSSLFGESATHRMSLDTLGETVRQACAGGGSQLAFAWQGGEPTLMGLDFFRQAVALQREHQRTGQQITNSLQTNGLVINDEWCEFLREHRFLVGLSLDGPQDIHNHYRKTKNGVGTWQQVVEAARRMLDQGVEVNALSVVTDVAARHAKEIYAFLKEQGLIHMQFIPCVEWEDEDQSRPTSFSVGSEQFGRFLCDVFDCWWADFENGRPTTYVRWFESVFATYLGLEGMDCTLQRECGDYLLVEHNGDVFACDFYVVPEWRLGNVLQDRLSDLLNSAQQQTFGRRKAKVPVACRSCQWLKQCYGGCPKERTKNELTTAPNHFCKGYQKFFRHADSRLQELSRDWMAEHKSVSPVAAPAPTSLKIGRNDPCPCGSGRKFKRCCGAS